jgi:hypothetical protein
MGKRSRRARAWRVVVWRRALCVAGALVAALVAPGSASAALGPLGFQSFGFQALTQDGAQFQYSEAGAVEYTNYGGRGQVFLFGPKAGEQLEVHCNGVKGQGAAPDGTTATQRLTAEYTGCTLAGEPATNFVAEYDLNANGTIEVLKTATIETETPGLCKVIVASQGPLGGIVYNAYLGRLEVGIWVTGMQWQAEGSLAMCSGTVSKQRAGQNGTYEAVSEMNLAGGVLEWLGAPFTQAGGHPEDLLANLRLKTTQVEGSTVPGGVVRSLVVELPPGLVGNPQATAKCPQAAAEQAECPADTQVGEIWVDRERHGATTPEEGPQPVFNVIPPRGVAARFAAEINGGVSTFIDAEVRSGDDYGITSGSYQISEQGKAWGARLLLWGVPGAAVHDSQRYCPVQVRGVRSDGPCTEAPSGLRMTPFLSMPTACTGLPLQIGALTDYYGRDKEMFTASTTMKPLIGCGLLQFNPALTTAPTTAAADSPTGLTVDLKVPQNEEPEGIATSDLKDARVAFPVGMAVNPSSADGLGTCSEEQVGFTGFTELNPTGEPGVRTPQFTPGPAECPDAAKLGNVEIVTPLLEEHLTGAMYLAAPHENPFGSLIAVYLAVYDPVNGVVVKLPGVVETDPRTGQITTVFKQNPQLPFEDLKVTLFSGEHRASLSTPETCGSYSTSTELAPWSGNPPATPSSEPFQINQGCANSEGEAPNQPGFSAGAVTPAAGSFSPFVMKLARNDGSQRFAGLSVTLPPGLIGKVAGVQECPQADIEAAQRLSREGGGAAEQAQPSCPAGSEVGVVHVGAGSGAPYYVSGKAYFAGPHNGAPFSLVFITPALAGPFDLGTVVVRAGIYIDPHTAQVSVKSDPLPTILDGIPLDIRSIGVEVTRPGFMLNPTSCEPTSVTGQEQSTAGHTASLSERFQVGGCATLPFHPTFTASTSGATSRKEGASLTVHIQSAPGQANIAQAHVQLPKQLPARNDTLKLACTEAVFAANPAACPEGSRVGSATAVTPLLNAPLTGPAYLVSHGGAAFPDLEIVLQGEGVEIVLDGKTNIDGKTGITSSSFSTVPDAPISSFTLSLPRGAHSILGAPAGVCSLTRSVLVKRKVFVKVKRHGRVVKRRGRVLRRKVLRKVKKSVAVGLSMPTTIVGQNGAVLRQATPILVQGCPVAKKKSKAKGTRKGKAKAMKSAKARASVRGRRSGGR